MWRNQGRPFEERTAALGLDKLATGLRSHSMADFDRDGDTDFLLAKEAGGLQLLSNEGGNANGQVKIDLVGHKSNASGIGIRIEAASGGLRLSRRGQAADRDWRGFAQANRVARRPLVGCQRQLYRPEGRSGIAVGHRRAGPCLQGRPYLYAWDGTRFVS